MTISLLLLLLFSVPSAMSSTLQNDERAYRQPSSPALCQALPSGLPQPLKSKTGAGLVLDTGQIYPDSMPEPYHVVMTTPEDADFSSKPYRDADTESEIEDADPLVEFFDDNFDNGTVYAFPELYTSKIKKHLKPVLPPEDPDPDESDQPKKKKKKKEKVPPEAHLIDEDLLQKEDHKLRAEESEWAVLEMVRAALDEVTGPDDPPAFLLHSQQMDSSSSSSSNNNNKSSNNKDSSGKSANRSTSSRGEKDVFVLHRRLGVIVLEVKAVENVQARSRIDEAASQLLHARHSLQRELGGLGEGAVSLAIALPNFYPDQAKVIRAQAKATGDPTVKTNASKTTPAEPPQPSPSPTEASIQSVVTSPQHPDVASTTHPSMASSDASSCPPSSAAAEASSQEDTEPGGGTKKIKAIARLGDHPEIELLCGKDLHLYRKWLQSILSRRAGSDPYVTTPSDDGDVIFKRAVCKHCSVPRYGETIRSAAQQHERWLLTPQQMQLRDLPDPDKTVVHLVGPPGAGKTLLLVHRARRWLGAGRRVVVMVGQGCRDTLLAQLGMTVLRGQRASDARDRLILCKNTVQLWDAAMAGELCVVVDELVDWSYDVLFRTGLHLMREGRVTAIWTASMKDVKQELVAEALTLGVTVRRETLSTCLRCCQEVVQLLNVVKPDMYRPLQRHRLPSPRSFLTGVEFLFHKDHDPSTPFHSCPACRDGAMAILRSLALPGFCPQDPAPTERSDCVIILTATYDTKSGMPQSVVELINWLQDLGLPVVCEWEMLCVYRYTEVTLPDASSSDGFGDKLTEKQAAWRERVLKGRDQAGKRTVHIVRSSNFLGLERKVVMVVHLDDRDDDPKFQGEADRDRRKTWHQRQWYNAASRCQGKLAFLVLSPSPALPLLRQAAKQARDVPSSSVSLPSATGQTPALAGTRNGAGLHPELAVVAAVAVAVAAVIIAVVAGCCF